MKKATFKTGNVGVEFVDESQAANRDTGVLQEMVNADIADNRRGDTFGKGGSDKLEKKG